MVFVMAPTSTCILDPLSKLKCCGMDIYKIELLMNPMCSKASVGQATLNSVHISYSILYPAQVSSLLPVPWVTDTQYSSARPAACFSLCFTKRLK